MVSQFYWSYAFWDFLFLIFLWCLPPYCFSPWVYNFTFSSTVHKGSIFSTSSSIFVICCLFDNSHSDKCEMIFHCGFDLQEINYTFKASIIWGMLDCSVVNLANMGVHFPESFSLYSSRLELTTRRICSWFEKQKWNSSHVCLKVSMVMTKCHGAWCLQFVHSTLFYTSLFFPAACPSDQSHSFQSEVEKERKKKNPKQVCLCFKNEHHVVS